MTNHTFKVITEQARRPYQGFPYVNPPIHDAPSIPPIDPNQAPESLPTRVREPIAGPSRPVHLELEPLQTATERAQQKVISQAERELRQNYGKESDQRQHQRYIDTVTSPYVDETIFYDPFENRRIAHPKESPSADTPNKYINADSTNQTPVNERMNELPSTISDVEPISEDIPYITPGSSAISAGSSGSRTPSSPLPGTSSTTGPSFPGSSYRDPGSSYREPGSSYRDPGSSYRDLGSSNGDPASSYRDTPGSSYPDLSSGPSSVYYSKESGIYGRTDPLPATIPVDQFPEPPPAYSEIDQVGPASPQEPPRVPVTEQPLPTNPRVITTPTPTVGQDPASLYNPSRKYVTCQFCRQQVLTIIRKEANSLTHCVALVNVCCGLFPCAVCVYCTDIFKESRHYCPNCDLMVGREEVTCTGIVYKETTI